MLISLYRCEFCGAEFKDWDPAHEHEQLHTEPSWGDRPIPKTYSQKDPAYPETIEVIMEDGAIVAYKKTAVVGNKPQEGEDES